MSILSYFRCVHLKMITLYDNMVLAYSLVWVQCSEIMSTKVKSNEKYAEMIREINILIFLAFIN